MGNIAPSDHDHTLAQRDVFPERNIPNRQRPGSFGAAGNHHRGKITTQIGKAHILSHLCAASDLYPEGLDHHNFCPNQLSWQTIPRDAGLEHARRLRLHFEDRGTEAHQRKIVPGGQARRARADDGDPFSGGFGKLGIGEKLEQVFEFLEIVTLARFRVALQIRKQFAAGVAPALASGELQERRLEHREEAETFYRDLAKQGMKVRVGMEASGHARWFERLLSELQFELWIGDAAEIRTKRVRKQKTDRQNAQLILQLMLEDRFRQIWVPSWEQPADLWDLESYLTQSRNQCRGLQSVPGRFPLQVVSGQFPEGLTSEDGSLRSRSIMSMSSFHAGAVQAIRRQHSSSWSAAHLSAPNRRFEGRSRL